MRFELANEMEVPASADDIWGVYSSPNFPKLIPQILPGVVERVDVVEGDGHLGTVLSLLYPPGTVPRTYKEKFVTIDHQKRKKEALQIEGGYLDMGCTFYMDSFHIIEKGCDSCIIRSMSTYDVKDEVAQNVFPLISIAKLYFLAGAVSKYVLDQKKAATTGGHGHGHGKC